MYLYDCVIKSNKMLFGYIYNYLFVYIFVNIMEGVKR